MKHLLLFTILIFTNGIFAISQENYRDGFLPQYLTEEEKERIHEIYQDKSATDPPVQSARSIAEFEPMSGALIRYPLGIPLSLVALISEEVEVVTIVANQSIRYQAVNDFQNHGVNLDNVSFLVAPTNSIWTRDYGPWYIFDGNNEFGIIDFQYDRPRPQDNAIPQIFANQNNHNYHHMGLVHTGGDFMSTGMGIGASTNAVYSVNSGLNPAEVDSIMELYLGINDYHVVPNIHGGLSHIDTWAKFLAPDKIMIREVDPSHQYYDLAEQAVEYFESQTSSYGTPFTVYRVYTPNNEPYTNSLILNDRVYVPTTGSAWDGAAIEAYEEAMPGYTVYGVFYNGWWSTDALHCRVREIPDSEMLYIHHMPTLQEQEAYEGYQIDARIIPMSGEALYPDSVLVYYQVNGGDFSSIVMAGGEDNWFSAEIPQQSYGAEISYYIFAADESGRREHHPYIGPYDPHTFSVMDEPEFTGFEGIATIAGGPGDVTDILISVGDLQTFPDETGWYQLEVTEGSYLLTATLNEHVPYHSDEIFVATGTTVSLDFELEYMAAPDHLTYDINGNDISLSWTYYPPSTKLSQINNGKSESQGFSHFNIYRSFEFDDFSKIDTSIETYYTDPNLENGVYSYFVTAVYDEVYESQPSDTVTTDIEVSVVSELVSPEPGLTRVFPNPFGQATAIGFYLENDSQVRIEIYDTKGSMVLTLTETYYPAGEHFIRWDGRDRAGNILPDGLYIIRFVSDQHTDNQNIIINKSVQ